jgi:hypothetical protein
MLDSLLLVLVVDDLGVDDVLFGVRDTAVAGVGDGGVGRLAAAWAEA